ncbi:protein CDC73-like protein [Sesbania bispinosa]|nr:protein CDC73-like protein [Sesbania bispinosa]
MGMDEINDLRINLDTHRGSFVVAATKCEKELQMIESKQRKDDLVAKSRLMSADERGLGFGNDLGFSPRPSNMASRRLLSSLLRLFKSNCSNQIILIIDRPIVTGAATKMSKLTLKTIKIDTMYDFVDLDLPP